ncbi:MAG: pitrilysin family protein [Anaeromyxobacteraceae bacterium]
MLAPLALAVTLLAPAPSGAPTPARLELQTFTLPNGLTVVLHPDHRLPQVVVNTWFHVGSKDEVPGRTGFAHLFEHLMFMGTKRVQGNQFDVIMEGGGGANNASTTEDRTNYYSFGPSSLLPTLLWLDADRFATLDQAMTKEKVDLQRDVVRNERRQSYENTPYGASELVIPDVMYPEGHPYHHPVIGSHADLQAASVEDVAAFFRQHYVPANATLVVAGDFDPEKVRPMVEAMFGAVPNRAAPTHPRPAPVALDHEIRRVVSDKVELPRLTLVWHGPPQFAPGTAERDLLSLILSEGPSSRLDRRLVQELRLATEVSATFEENLLQSRFRIDVTGVPGADLERVKRETLAVVAELAAKGPTPAEVTRVKAGMETRFRVEKEQLLRRADRMNQYLAFFGEPDAFDRDLARYTGATAAGVKDAARSLGEGRLDLRVLPASDVAAAIPDQRPADLAPGRFTAPAPEVAKLSNGVEVRIVRQPGSGLVSGHVLAAGGERLVPAEKSGLASVVAALLVSGAGGKSAPEWADAIRTLGAQAEARATRNAIDLSFVGLAAKLGPTLDLVADAVLRPNLAQADVERELDLARSRAEARAAEPRAVAAVATAATLYGPEDYRGRPTDGYARTLASATPADVRTLAPRLLDPRGAVIVVVGDVEAAAVKAALEARFGRWQARGPAAAAAPAPITATRGGRWFLVDRPGAPQTVIQLARPVARADDVARLTREAVNTALGGSFTSRLNQNLREKNGYTYGASSRVLEDGLQTTFVVSTSVQTEVTGPALLEIKKELGALAAGLPEPELLKVRESLRFRMVEQAQTTQGLGELLAREAMNGHPPDALRRDAEALSAIDAAKAAATAKDGTFALDGMTIVLVGDRKVILPQLEKAGFPVPALLDGDGRPVR